MTVTIPEVDYSIPAQPTGLAHAEQEPTESVLAKPRILVIDDDAGFCELLCLYFMAKGFDVITARTTAEAQLFIAEGRFDLVIMDWLLNDADALDLLNLTKSRYPGIPILIFTGADDSFLKEALAGRVEGVLRKMNSLEVLSSQVCHHLGWPELRVVK